MMTVQRKYKIIKMASLKELSEEVNQLISEGIQGQGGFPVSIFRSLAMPGSSFFGKRPLVSGNGIPPRGNGLIARIHYKLMGITLI